MIKYAKNDISDGIKSLSIGIGNIVAAIVRKELSEYTLDMPMDYFLMTGALRKMFPMPMDYFLMTGALRKMFPGIDIKYSDNSMIILIESTLIRISFEEKNTVFSLV